MTGNYADNVVNDELADRQQSDWQQCGNDPEDDPEKHDRGTGLPHNINYRRQLANAATRSFHGIQNIVFVCEAFMDSKL